MTYEQFAVICTWLSQNKITCVSTLRGGEGERESYFYGIIFQYFSLIANCDHLLYLTLPIVNSLLHYR